MLKLVLLVVVVFLLVLLSIIVVAVSLLVSLLGEGVGCLDDEGEEALE